MDIEVMLVVLHVFDVENQVLRLLLVTGGTFEEKQIVEESFVVMNHEEVKENCVSEKEIEGTNEENDGDEKSTTEVTVIRIFILVIVWINHPIMIITTNITITITRYDNGSVIIMVAFLAI